MNRPDDNDTKYIKSIAVNYYPFSTITFNTDAYLKDLEHYCDLIEELAEKRFKEKIMFEEDCYRLYNAFDEACRIITTLDDSHCLSDWKELCLKAGNKGVVHHNESDNENE